MQTTLEVWQGVERVIVAGGALHTRHASVGAVDTAFGGRVYEVLVSRAYAAGVLNVAPRRATGQPRLASQWFVAAVGRHAAEQALAELAQDAALGQDGAL